MSRLRPAIICRVILSLCCVALIFEKYATALRIQLRPTLFRTSTTAAIAPSLQNLHSKLTHLSFRVNDRDIVQKRVVVEEEVEDEDDEELLNGDVLNRLSKGVIPVAASLGFAVTPSPNVVIRFAGAAAGGVAGFFIKRAIDKRIELIEETSEEDEAKVDGALPPQVAAALKSLKAEVSLLNYDMEALESLAKKFKVAEDDLAFFFTLFLAEVIYRETNDAESMDLTDMMIVVDFIKEIGFSSSEVGDAFSLAAVKIGKQLKKDKRGFYEDDFPLSTFLQSTKMFFLADKLIGNLEGFYGKRVATLLSSYFPSDKYQEVISEACEKLFARCIDAVLNDSNVRKEEVDRIREFLTTSTAVSTLRPANMQNLVMQAVLYKLDGEVRHADISAPAGDIGIESYEAYARAQKTMGVNMGEMISTIETRTVPAFEKVARSLFTQVFEKPELATSLADVLRDKATSLKLDGLKARVVVNQIFSEYNQRYMERIEKVYANSNGKLEPAFKIMVNHAHMLENFQTLSRHIIGDSEIPLPGLPFAEKTRQLLFELQQEQQQAHVSSSSHENFEEMFALSPAQKQRILQNLAIPKIVSWVAQCLQERNYAAGAKLAYQKLLQQQNVSPDDWRSTAMDFYYQEVKKMASLRAVPSQEDVAQLQAIQSFLEVDGEAVQSVHLEHFGEKYVKAVTEAMTPTGIISEEYKQGLERLRLRLSLSEEDALLLVSVAARQRIAPMLNDIVDLWKSSTDAAYRAEKEERERKDPAAAAKKQQQQQRGTTASTNGDQTPVFGFMDVTVSASSASGGPNTFMREILNLVDIVRENYEVRDFEFATTDRAPITAVGMLNKDDLIGVFKYFLISRLTESNDELRNRYRDAEAVLVKVLGFSDDAVVKAKQSFAYSAYKSLLHQVLWTKDAADASDIQQFALLRDTLPLPSDSAETIFNDCVRHSLLDHALALFGKENGLNAAEKKANPNVAQILETLTKQPVSPADAQRFRTQVPFHTVDISMHCMLAAHVVSHHRSTTTVRAIVHAFLYSLSRPSMCILALVNHAHEENV